jgi:protein-tyrosine-phosphatase
MAAAWVRELGGDRIEVHSGGSEPADRLNKAVVAAMAEIGIDITEASPKRWSDDELRSADVVVTMGCGDECPFYPGKRYVDWELPDPSGKSLEEVRPIRDEIEKLVRDLLGELLPEDQASRHRGETEKNLSRALDEAERSEVDIVFEEGDELFGR